MEIEQDVAQSTAMSIARGIVFALGLVLIGIGLWSLGGAIYAAWELFKQPESIAYFAQYFLESTRLATLVPSGAEGLAHYLAWIAVVLLLLVLGKLGAWALGAGALLLNLDRRK